MRIPRLPARPWVAVAAVLAAAAILLTVIHQGNATANTGPPGTPDNTLAHLIVPDGEEPRIRVSWDAPDAEVSDYTITRADGQTFSANGAATTFSDHTVESGTAYSYSVTAQNDQGTSTSSETAPASVPDAPSQPGDLAAEVAEIAATDTAASVTLTWTASTVPAAAACETAYPLDGYTVMRSDGDDESEIATPDSGATSFTDASAAFGTNYTYRVMARNAIGTSTVAETMVSVSVPPVPPATGLTATITDPFDGNVSLSWTAPNEGPAIVGYMVFRYDGTADPETGTDLPTTLAELETGTSLTDSAVEAGVTYSYMVLAQSADNVSDPSNTAVIEPPAPPTNVAATANDGTIDLTWSAPTAGTVAEYRVERQQDGAWTTLTDTAETNHSDNTAATNVPYRYQVQHRNQYGGSTWAESGTVTLLAVPGQPTGLTAALDGNDVNLSWTAPTDGPVNGYHVQHQEADADWQELASTTSTTQRHAGAVADVEHRYRVRAHNQAGNGPWSSEASTTRVTPPSTSTGLAASVDGNDIAVSWTRPDSVHLNGYELGVSRSDTETETTESLGADATSYQVSDAAADVTYSFRIRAHNDGGTSAWSDTVDATRVVVPVAPATIEAQAGDTDITVTWSASTARFVDGYQVSYGPADGDERQTADLDADTTSYTHADSVEGTTYQYQVRAHNQAGNGPWSQAVQATRLNAPGAPTSIAATVSGGVIVVEWDAPADGIVETYEVQYGVQGRADTQTDSVASTELEFTHVNPEGDTRYEYRVRAVNAAGASPWSEPADAMRVIPPAAPTGVAVAISNSDLVVSWTAPSSAFLDGYQVEHRQLNTADWMRNEVDSNTTGHTHIGPTAGATYEYRVRAFNQGGFSAWTEPVNGVWYETAAPPASIYSMPFGPTQVMVRWTASVTPGVTGYDVRRSIDGGEWTTTSGVPRTFQIASWSSDQSTQDYQVRAVIDDAAGNWSPTFSLTIDTPGAISNLRHNREGQRGIRFHWDEPTTGEPDFYVVQVQRKNGSYENIESVKGHTTTASYYLQSYGATRNYRVLARNHMGITGPHNADDTATMTLPAAPSSSPEAVTNVDAKVIDGNTVKLTWQAPKQRSQHVTSYRIYRKEASDTRRMGTSFHDHVLVRQTGNKQTQYVDHTAEAGVLYEYAVAAYRASLNPQSSGVSPQKAYAQAW